MRPCSTQSPGSADAITLIQVNKGVLANGGTFCQGMSPGSQFCVVIIVIEVLNAEDPWKSRVGGGELLDLD